MRLPAAFTHLDRPDTPAAGGTGWPRVCGPPCGLGKEMPPPATSQARILSGRKPACQPRWERGGDGRTIGLSRGVNDGHLRAGRSIAFAEKFRPFRLTTVDGRTIDVEDEGAFMIGKSDMSYRAADGSFRWERIAYDQLESIEFLGQWKHWHVR